MKRFLLFLLFVYSFGFAQSNLVFNEVKTVTLLDGGVTVPEGKVWKVESFSNNGFYKASIIVDGDQFLIPPERVFWVEGGSSVSTGGNSLSSGYTGAISLNVIEFNVVAVSADTGSSSGVTSIDDFNTDGAGTSYGDDYTPSESVTDYDGNVYETVTIGPQTWTTSNLNVSTYRDGTPIPHITDFNEWQTTTTGAYTYVNQDENSIYGKVYNVWAVIGKYDNDPNTPHKKLAPEGYHVSTYFEWNSLKEYYGADPYASSYLRSELGWLYDLNGSNESGLNLLPGFAVIAGVNSNPNLNGFYGVSNVNTTLSSSRYATSTPASQSTLKGVSVDQSAVNLESYEFRGYVNSMDGFYVRLVKN